MKRFLLSLLAVILLLSLFGCSEEPIEKTYSPTLSCGGLHGSPMEHDLVLNKNLLEDKSHYPVLKFSTFEELDAFAADYTSTASWDEVPAFKTAIADYDADFFEDNLLMIVYIQNNTTSIRFGLDRVSVDGDTLCVYFKQTNFPSAFQDAMASWFLLVPVSKVGLDNVKNYDAVFVGTP